MKWEAEYELLRAQYKALRPKLDEITEEEREATKRRIKSRQDDVKITLAKEFKRYIDAGMPRYVIQKVIGTNDWKAYKEWERLGDIPTARDISIEREKAALKTEGYEWADDYSTLTVTKSPKGNKIENPPVYLIGGGVYRSGRYLTSKLVDDAAERTPAREDPTAYLQGVSDEIARQMDAGNVPDIRN